MAAVANLVDAKITVVRNALEALGNEDALNALESVLDLSSLERELIEDGARRRTFALLQVQEGLSKLRAVDDVAMIVDRAPRELVQSCRIRSRRSLSRARRPNGHGVRLFR